MADIGDEEDVPCTMFQTCMFGTAAPVSSGLAAASVATAGLLLKERRPVTKPQQRNARGVLFILTCHKLNVEHPGRDYRDNSRSLHFYLCIFPLQRSVMTREAHHCSRPRFASCT